MAKRKRWWVGCKNGTRIVFGSVETPTDVSHGEQFRAVVGPIRTKKLAEWTAAHPYFQGSLVEMERTSNAKYQ